MTLSETRRVKEFNKSYIGNLKWTIINLMVKNCSCGNNASKIGMEICKNLWRKNKQARGRCRDAQENLRL